MAYVKYQPLGEDAPLYNEDCLIRAISKWRYFDKGIESWDFAIAFAAKMSLETRVFPPNIDKTICRYFGNHGCKVVHLTKQQSINTRANQAVKPCFLMTRDHVVYAQAGKYYDSWVSGNRKVKTIIYLDDFKN